MFAMESAMDELAHALRMDPIELRRINDTQVEPVKGLRFTSRHLMECFDKASTAFGWSRRNPEPGATRDGEWLVGLGCASAIYPSYIAPAAVRVTLSPDGRAAVRTAAAEIGNGAYTIVALTAAELLGLKVEAVEVQLGDTDLPPAPIAGGSNVTASVCNVTAKACEEIQTRIAAAAVRANDTPFAGRDPRHPVSARRRPGRSGRPARAAGDRAVAHRGRGHRGLCREHPPRCAAERDADALQGHPGHRRGESG